MIRMRNFMTHTDAVLYPSCNTNFIIGLNGRWEGMCVTVDFLDRYYMWGADHFVALDSASTLVPALPAVKRLQRQEQHRVRHVPGPRWLPQLHEASDHVRGVHQEGHEGGHH